MSDLPVTVKGFTFDDEFGTFTSSPDGKYGTWMTTYPYGGGADRTLPPNKEAEYYSDSSVGENPFSLSGGVLSLTASVAAPSSNPDNLPYDSGLITTYRSFAQTYGYVEISAKLPCEQGLWPAFWLLPADNHTPAELDVFEQIDDQPTTIYSTTHGFTNGSNSGISQKITVPDTATASTPTASIGSRRRSPIMSTE